MKPRAAVDFEVGERLGEAVIPRCDDTPNDGDDPGPPDSTVAYAIKGLHPDIAITVDQASDDILFVAVDSRGELPPEVKRLINRS
ncbi:DUF6281 family protein [Streptomyces sp. NPDC091292]|uniref:DUF6281 family protein n=1 Tax=Streptomyces sp. NPDC091292 TaxID=3365991 RepID=UPI003821CFC5